MRKTVHKKREKINRTGCSASKNELLYGLLPVSEALSQKRRRLEHLYLKSGAESSERVKKIRRLAETLRLPLSEVAVNQLREMCPDALHQGVVLRCGPLPFISTAELPPIAAKPFPLLVALDQIEDPHNFGAILRTCGFFNVNAAIVPHDRTSGLTPTVSKSSAGVAEYFPVLAVPNLARFLQEQKSQGYWVVGLDGESPRSVSELVRDRPLILVLGNEGRGIRPLIRKRCDWSAAISGNPEVSSLNVSNAAAVVLYHLSTCLLKS